MIRLVIEEELEDLKFLVRGLSEKRLVSSKVRAINRAIGRANTVYLGEITKRYALQRSSAKDYINIQRATYRRSEGYIEADKRPVSISRFSPEFVRDRGVRVSMSIKNIRRDKKGKRSLTQISKKLTDRERSRKIKARQIGGVTFQILRGGKKNLPFAFMTSSDRNRGVAKQIWARGKYAGNKFVRGKDRYPIEPLKTFSFYRVMSKGGISKSAERQAVETMEAEFRRQIERLF